MNEWNELYQQNRLLDDMYKTRYYESVEQYYEKNCLELIVELGELANETKCFKYWTIKKPKIDTILEEYADCMLMILCLYDHFDIDKVELTDIQKSNNIIVAFNDIFYLCTQLMMQGTKGLVKDIFTYLLHFSELLYLDKKEIWEACYKKIEKNKERLSSDY